MALTQKLPPSSGAFKAATQAQSQTPNDIPQIHVPISFENPNPNPQPHPNRSQKSNFLNFAWGSGDSLTLFASTPFPTLTKQPPPPSPPAQESENEPTKSNVCSLQMVTMSWDAVPSEFRKLVRIGREEFVKLQEFYARAEENSNQNQEPPAHVALLRYSQTLRLHLDAAVSDLDARIDMLTESKGEGEEGNVAATSELERFLQSAKGASMVWHLSEIMSLEATTFAYIPMVTWVYQHFPRWFNDELVAQSQDVRKSGSESSSFWGLVYYFTLRGDLPSAWAHLRHHSKYQSLTATPERLQDELVRCFHSIRHIMHTMPRLEDNPNGPSCLSNVLTKTKIPMETETETTRDINGGGNELALSRREGEGLVVGFGEEQEEHGEEETREGLRRMWVSASVRTDRVVEFKARWAEWSRSVQRLKEEFGSMLLADAALNRLVQIMVGDIDAIIQALDSPRDSWPQVLAACLLYSTPSSHKSEFADLANSCMEFRSKKEEKETVLAVLQGDFLKALQYLHARSGDKWVCAHLAELLCRAEVIEAVSLSSSPPLDTRYFAETDFMLGDIELDAREFFLLDYAVQLGLGGYQPFRQAHAPINWRFAIDYFARCERLVPLSAYIQPETGIEKSPSAFKRAKNGTVTERAMVRLGRAYAHLVVDNQVPLNDRFVTKLVFGCRRLGLSDLATSLLRERAMFWWCHAGGRQKYITSSTATTDSGVGFSGVANALLWAAQCGDGFAERLVRFLFAHGSIDALKSVVDHISPSIDTGLNLLDLDVQALRFLAAYKEVRACLDHASKEFATAKSMDNEGSNAHEHFEAAWEKRDEACRRFCRTLREINVPERFRLPIIREMLLWEAKPPHSETVLSNPPLISIEDCTLLMQCIEKLELALDRNKLVGNLKPPSELAAIRLMLTQALSRSVILTGVYSKQVV